MEEIKIDKLIRSKRRSIALIVSSEATLIVRAPMRTTLEYIEGLVFEKRAWIKKKKDQILKNSWPAKKCEELSQEKALEKITERVNFYSRITGWKFKSVSITKAESRWGSCGPNNSINFSRRLIMAPIDVIDYVVVHELAHIAEKNHSKKFWDKVEAILPDYKEKRKWLKEKGHNLKI